MSDKGKENEATQQLAGLHLGAKSSGQQERPPQPPRPPQPRRPVQPLEEDEDEFEEEDENDPFADRNAVTPPKVERGEPQWYVISWDQRATLTISSGGLSDVWISLHSSQHDGGQFCLSYPQRIERAEGLDWVGDSITLAISILHVICQSHVHDYFATMGFSRRDN